MKIVFGQFGMHTLIAYTQDFKDILDRYEIPYTENKPSRSKERDGFFEIKPGVSIETEDIVCLEEIMRLTNPYGYQYGLAWDSFSLGYMVIKTSIPDYQVGCLISKEDLL